MSPCGSVAVTAIWTVGPVSTDNATVAVVEPDALVAVTVYVAEADRPTGVPEITPVAESNNSPVGSIGLIAYEVGVPVTIGVKGVINTPRNNGAGVA